MFFLQISIHIFQIHEEDVRKRDAFESKLSDESKKRDDLKKELKQVNDKLDKTEKVNVNIQ